MTTAAFDQSDYQVRLEWGVAGLARLAPADVVVVVDVLRFSTTVTRALEADPEASFALDGSAHAVSINGAAIARVASVGTTTTTGGATASTAPVVLLGCLRNASAVARACLAIQRERGERTSVAVLAGGELAGGEQGAPLRFAVEDLLGAGAVIAALSELGTDHTSPDAAAACETYLGLRRAVGHLVSASGSGRELHERGRGDEVAAAAEVNVTDIVPHLVDGAFVRA